MLDLMGCLRNARDPLCETARSDAAKSEPAQQRSNWKHFATDEKSGVRAPPLPPPAGPYSKVAIGTSHPPERSGLESRATPGHARVKDSYDRSQIDAGLHPMTKPRANLGATGHMSACRHRGTRATRSTQSPSWVRKTGFPWLCHSAKRPTDIFRNTARTYLAFAALKAGRSLNDFR